MEESSVSNLGLGEAIDAVRRELVQAHESRPEGGVRFEVGSVEIEFVVDVEETDGGEASVKVLGVFSFGARGEVSRGDTSRVKVTLNPTGPGGGAFEVASETAKRPDGVGRE